VLLFGALWCCGALCCIAVPCCLVLCRGVAVSCIVLLQGAAVLCCHMSRFHVTFLCRVSVSHSCVAFPCHIPVSRSRVAFPCRISMSHSCASHCCWAFIMCWMRPQSKINEDTLVKHSKVAQKEQLRCFFCATVSTKKNTHLVTTHPQWRVRGHALAFSGICLL
jgi:hypothetical protein